MVPHVFGQGCFRLVVVVFKAFFVIVKSEFEFGFGASDIFCLFSVFVLYRGVVYYFACAALTGYGACRLVLAVASLCCCGFFGG